MWSIVRELLADGVAVLLTTQYLEEADRVADRVAVLNHGHIVGEGSPAELKSRVGSDVLIVQGPDRTPVREIPIDGTADGLRRALLDISEVGTARVSLRAPSLDDVFFALTGAQSRTKENA
jgi:ABC-2 type transport system ATP-binding protein